MSPPSPLRIYFVEDNPAIRNDLISALDDLVGITTVGWADGERQGSEWLLREDTEWDLAIVDLFLSDGNGLGVLHALRGRDPARKVVVLSNYASPDMRRRCTNLGADVFFDKSADVEALIDYCVQLRAATGRV